MEWNITGTIKFEVNFDIEANSEEEAMEIATDILNDYYHLDVNGAHHDPNDVEIEICPSEYLEDDEDE